MNLKKIENPFGGLTFYHETTTSTMWEAESLIENDIVNGTLVVADFQTRGIGRIPGRKWESQSKNNLLFTLILKKDFVGHGYVTIPLRTGLALSKTVMDLTGCKAEVKWPNDIVVDGRKISGILCQAKKSYLLIGVGVNVNQLTFENELAEKATSMSLLANKGYSTEMVLTNFLNKLSDVLGNKNWLDELNQQLYMRGEEVKFAVGNPENKKIVTGTLEGLDDQGKVIIRDNNGVLNSYLSGEFIK